jgi:hypothetical protein
VKKGYCEPGLGLPFPTLFGALFASFSPFHAVWVLLLFLKGHIPPQMCKKDWGNFFLDFILHSVPLSAKHEKRVQKGVQKGCKRVQKGAKRVQKGCQKGLL